MNQSNSTNISETALSESMLQGLKQSAKDALTRLGLDTTATPDRVVAAVDAAVRDMQNAGTSQPSDPYDDAPVYFGSLWCEQLVATLGWEWTQLTFHDHGDSKAIGIVSPDRSMMICPFHFVFGCLVHGAPVTIELSYQFLQNLKSTQTQQKVLGELPRPKEYANVMECVHPIVPPF